MIFGLGIAAVFGGLFPIIINNVLKIEGLIEPGLQSTITFAVLAVIVYGSYMILHMLYELLKVSGKVASIPIKFLGFVGYLTIRLVSYIGHLIMLPIKYLADKQNDSSEKIDKNEKKNKKEETYDNHTRDDDDDNFWERRQEDEPDTFNDDNDIFVAKSENIMDTEDKPEVKKDTNSFLSKVYADYEEFEKDKKKKKD